MDTLLWYVAGSLAALGTLFVLLAAVGILRMPDLFTRMHASSKAATLGAILVLSAVAVRSGDAAVIVRVVLICLFLFLTAPVAAHVIARAATRTGVPLSDETVLDELSEHRKIREE
ncbi:MAG: monovalent cation/H(+) antiporter subunit G [Planctomycetes bacterium]|jgi:multicomponent Na+:H+ antiporter subunit G|nr:monovalent cation/H(+) antiporter subunit G [Planctomycetota bacterium]